MSQKLSQHSQGLSLSCVLELWAEPVSVCQPGHCAAALWFAEGLCAYAVTDCLAAFLSTEAVTSPAAWAPVLRICSARGWIVTSFLVFSPLFSHPSQDLGIDGGFLSPVLQLWAAKTVA